MSALKAGEGRGETVEDVTCPAAVSVLASRHKRRTNSGKDVFSRLASHRSHADFVAPCGFISRRRHKGSKTRRAIHVFYRSHVTVGTSFRGGRSSCYAERSTLAYNKKTFRMVQSSSRRMRHILLLLILWSGALSRGFIAIRGRDGVVGHRLPARPRGDRQEVLRGNDGIRGRVSGLQQRRLAGRIRRQRGDVARLRRPVPAEPAVPERRRGRFLRRDPVRRRGRNSLRHGRLRGRLSTTTDTTTST